MNWKVIVGLIFTGLLLSCSDKDKDLEDPSTFQNHFDTLEQVTLPITLSTKNWQSLHQKHIKKFNIADGGETIDHPYARIGGTKNYEAFIFSSPDESGSPVLLTLDGNGKVIDQLILLGDLASNNPSKKNFETAIINKRMRVELTDSTWTYNVNMDGQRIDPTAVLTMRKKVFKISKFGKIEKVR